MSINNDLTPTTNPFKERGLEDIKVDYTSYPGENNYFILDTSYYSVVRPYSKVIYYTKKEKA